MTALLFVDLESTSLDPAKLTMLEFAWCITNVDGTQRLPMRSRYTLISAAEELVYPTHGMQGLSFSRWANPEHGSAVALRMAEESRLCAGWLACPSEQIVTSRGELQRLLLDDIAAACDSGVRNPDTQGTKIYMPGQARPSQWVREPECIHLAGSGVAQFDQPVLRLLCSTVVPPFGERGATHYRPDDTSVAQMPLLGGTEDSKLIEWAVREYPGIADIDLDVFPLRYVFPDRDTETWMATEKMHRAAADLARSIVLHRALWAYGAPLRKALGLQDGS